MVQLSKKTIKTITFSIHACFIAVIAFQLIDTALSELPGSWFFFITSGAIENLICAAIAFTLNYHVFKIPGIWKTVVFVMFFILILFIFAGLKDFRIHNYNSFEQSFEYFTNFLGETVLFYLSLYLIGKLDRINRYKQLERELHQAREQLLRNQMHPHFLFNAFNSIYSLCLKNSTEAAGYILKLSSMMRYLTDETQRDKVPLNEELDFIKKYIDIEKMRFGQHAPIQFNTSGAITGDKLIEPFLLIALVENAFKHGFYTNANDAFVNISLSMENHDLSFCVENSVFAKQHFQQSNRKGKGLQNLRQRLHLLYPKNSSLEINEDEGRYAAALKIILN